MYTFAKDESDLERYRCEHVTSGGHIFNAIGPEALETTEDLIVIELANVLRNQSGEDLAGLTDDEITQALSACVATLKLQAVDRRATQ